MRGIETFMSPLWRFLRVLYRTRIQPQSVLLAGAFFFLLCSIPVKPSIHRLDRLVDNLVTLVYRLVIYQRGIIMKQSFNKFGPFPIKTVYCNEKAWASISRYVHEPDQPGLTFYALDGEPLLKASICLEGVKIEDGEILIKNWSENSGIQECLEDLKLIGPEIDFYASYYSIATKHKMLGKLLDAWNEFKQAREQREAS